MAGRHQMSSSVTAAGYDLYCTDIQDSAAPGNAQQTNGHIDFSFRKRLEKIDWRKIGSLKAVFLICNLCELHQFVNKITV